MSIKAFLAFLARCWFARQQRLALPGGHHIFFDGGLCG